jgi:hypothetical protein
MQRCNYQFISKILHVRVVGQYGYHTDNSKSKMTMQEQEDNGLICSKWEEAIIKEHRMPDIPLDLMQKYTIDEIYNNAHSHKNDKKEESNLNGMMKPSN